MKTNGRIRELLAIPCNNDIEYGHRVIWPLLDYLGVPPDMRRPQFQIENPFGDGLLRLDYLIHVGDIPMVTIEGEPHAKMFTQGYRQAKNYSTNFKPRQKRCPMREMTVPFLIVAAGTRAEMRRATARGLNIEFEPVLDGGQPAFLEWHELYEEASRIPAFGPPPSQRELFAAEALGLRIEEAQPVLKADAARQFFDDLYAAIDAVAALRDKDDRKIILFNEIVDLARGGRLDEIHAHCLEAGLGPRAAGRVLEALDWYEKKIVANEFSGAPVARGYRNFLLQPGGRGGHQYFTGETQHRPLNVRGRVRYRSVARYFTPTEIIQQMVRLASPRADERVIDMTCGSGGFLAECMDFIAQAQGNADAQQFLTTRLVGTDDDPFCVSCSRSLLTFLDPEHRDSLLVFLHNALYEKAPQGGELEEDPAAEPCLQPGSYDLVIGNPPGNDEYSGTNREEVERQWAIRFGHAQGGLMDHHCFIRRAVELARPDGGRVCLLVPEGLLARDNRGMPALRHELLRDCEVRAVISLPRVFKNNNARMAILYLTRNPSWNGARQALLASVSSIWRDEDGEERSADVFAELESIVDYYLNEVEPRNVALPPGEGAANSERHESASGENE